jgi:hypothetical protein
MAQVISHQPFNVEAWIHARVSPCGIYGGQSGAGAGFSPSSSVSPVSIISPWLSILIHRLGRPQLRHSLTPLT